MSPGSAIVATASLAGLTPLATDPIYSLTKHAVIGFVRSMAPQFESRGIRICALAPGIVDTPFIDHNRTGLEAAGFPLLRRRRSRPLPSCSWHERASTARCGRSNPAGSRSPSASPTCQAPAIEAARAPGVRPPTEHRLPSGEAVALPGGERPQDPPATTILCTSSGPS